MGHGVVGVVHSALSGSNGRVGIEDYDTSEALPSAHHYYVQPAMMSRTMAQVLLYNTIPMGLSMEGGMLRKKEP